MNTPLLVSNRLPAQFKLDADGVVTVEPSNGGLATGLAGPWKRTGARWIGHAEVEATAGVSWSAEVMARLDEERLIPVEVDEKVMEGYYGGISNGLLWPVFHDRIDQIAFEPGDWEDYVSANAAFAETVLREMHDDQVVWVHDYHLCLVPELVRARRPGARIGFFLHVPFPSRDAFTAIPWRDELLRGILGADFVAFHTPGYLANFVEACRHLGIAQANIDGVMVGQRQVSLGVLPLGIDAKVWAEESDQRQPETEALLGDLKGERLLLGVDRLDYSKGVPRRLKSVDALLESRPDLVGKIRFLQVGAPTREDVAAYSTYRRAVEELVGKINGKWANGSWVPVHNIERVLSRSQLIPLYRAADVMVVTPLRDGLNLVAKEFVATRTDGDGVLVLSEFAGAATELAGAVEVNPFDITETAAAMARALDMPPEERRERMQTLRKRVMEWDADAWFDEFLAAVARAALIRYPGTARSDSAQAVVQGIPADARLRLLLDYDGTLVPFADDPEQARPDPELLGLLSRLTRDPHVAVHIVTGRSRSSIDGFLGHLPLSIHAEHGLWSRPAAGRLWSANTAIANNWMMAVRQLLAHFVAVVPGSFLEEKAVSLAWHYRAAADMGHAVQRSREIEDVLAEIGASDGLQVLRGSCVIEVRPRNLHKGLVAQLATSGLNHGEVIVAAGDDRTDEDLFRSLPPGALTIHVGGGPSAARLLVEDYRGLRSLLWGILGARRAAEPTDRLVAGRAGKD